MARQTAAEKVAAELQQAILEGRYAPGEPLAQRKIAATYNVATITVREAFQRLCQTGLVVVEPKWGARVADADPRIERETYAVREALEGMAARLAAQVADSRDREELTAAAAAVDAFQDSPEPDSPAGIRAHVDLHLAIARASHNRLLYELIERLMLQRLLWINARLIEWDVQRQKPGWHQKLVKTITSGDPEKAEATMREHVRWGLELEEKGAARRRNPPA